MAVELEKEKSRLRCKRLYDDLVRLDSLSGFP